MSVLRMLSDLFLPMKRDSFLRLLKLRAVFDAPLIS
jgi:hypothetical protein